MLNKGSFGCPFLCFGPVCPLGLSFSASYSGLMPHLSRPSLFHKDTLMPVVQISEALLDRNTATDGRILRDRQLSGFLMRLHARRRTFWVATSAAGVQVRLRIGHWPLMSVDEARAKALEVIRQCRQGIRPDSPMHVCAASLSELPTLQALLTEYCKAKGIKPSSQSRYESILRCHFHDWLALSVSELQQPRFVSA